MTDVTPSSPRSQRLKETLNINPKITIGYQAHSDTMVKSGSIAKNRYVV